MFRLSRGRIIHRYKPHFPVPLFRGEHLFIVQRIIDLRPRRRPWPMLLHKKETGTKTAPAYCHGLVLCLAPDSYPRYWCPVGSRPPVNIDLYCRREGPWGHRGQHNVTGDPVRGRQAIRGWGVPGRSVTGGGDFRTARWVARWLLAEMICGARWELGGQPRMTQK